MDAIVTALACAMAAAIAIASHAAPSPTQCPTGQSDDMRAAQIRDALARTEEGARLSSETVASGLPPPRLCFTDGEPGIVRDRSGAPLALLERHTAVHAQAARFAHLWQHVLDDKPASAPSPGESCGAWLTETRDAEARGDDVEARVLRALGASTSTDPTRRQARDAAYAKQCAALSPI